MKGNAALIADYDQEVEARLRQLVKVAPALADLLVQWSREPAAGLERALSAAAVSFCIASVSRFLLERVRLGDTTEAEMELTEVLLEIMAQIVP